MSGICGLVGIKSDTASDTVRRMLGGVRISPDETQDTICSPPAVLGVSREWPFQSIGTCAGVTAAIDADLIDDNDELATTLDDSLKTPSPTEKVIGLYLKWGAEFVTRLHGGFSVALWDTREQRLVLAIDRAGLKGLYWRREFDRVLFASRISAIRFGQSAQSVPNLRAILQYFLFACVPAPLTSDQGTHKMRPGTMIVFEGGEQKESQYWDASYEEDLTQSESHWANTLRETMRGAVHRHVRGLPPNQTGCFLSGGTDSSSVVAFCSEIAPPKSFSIAFAEEPYSEIDFARTAANRFHATHFEKVVGASDATEALDAILNYFDEPFANSSAIGTFHCAKLAYENGVTTLLAGDGGDELFGGNERYALDQRFALYGRLPKWLRSGLLEPLAGVLPDEGGVWTLPKRYIRRANIPNPARIHSYNFFLSLAPHEVFEDEFLRQIGTDKWLEIPEMHFAKPRARSELNRVLYMDLKMTLADNDIRKVSGTSELAGVNVRYPLLDDHLLEFAGRLPARLKLKGFQKRYIFKKAMQGILPDKILYKKKHGFGVPVSQWLLEDQQMRAFLCDLANDQKTQERGYFKKSFIQRLLAMHKMQPNYYGEIIWYLLVLETWHRRHLTPAREVSHAT